MACTGLKFPKQEGNGTNRMKVITEVNGKVLVISYYACDKDFIPFGKAEITMSEKAEEKFHKELRDQANEKGHFIRNESTNPEWNPDYIEERAPGPNLSIDPANMECRSADWKTSEEE